MTSPGDPGHNRLADPALLDKIDKLFSCDVGKHIDLPQLVVVGDQSSGKSSVLEGLTRLPFPRDSGLCTRYVTHIIFRRAPQKTIKYRIVVSSHASAEHVERVNSCRLDLNKGVNAESFPEIMRQVHLAMRLPVQGQTVANPRNFSDDIFQLEICGPEEDHLSVIDIPGIFKNTTPGKTTKEDMEMVRKMVQSYMRNPRSVMLTVVPANVDIATQEIVEMAKELDPEGCRTLGVLTKPDLVDKGGEKGIIDLVNGKIPGTKVQWSVVRNPGQMELKDQNADREAEKLFFQDTSPWNTIDKNRTGIDALRARLRDVITDHTRREFPKVKLEIEKKLKVAIETLDSLGNERGTAEKQRKYLLDIVAKFQRLTYDALTANYGSNSLFDEQKDLRLPTKLVHRNELFSTQLEKFGQQYLFCSENKTTAKTNTVNGVTNAPKAQGMNVRTTSGGANIKDILHSQEVIPSPSGGIMDWLEAKYRDSRGFELGTFNSSFLQSIMKTQSTKWPSLALGYIGDAVVIVHTFIVRLLESVCLDRKVRERLLATILDDLIERYKMAIEQVRFLLNVERSGTHLTQNHYFNENLEKYRQERMRSMMEEKAVNAQGLGKVVKIDALIQHPSMSNAKHVVQNIHDILGAYYKVARKRFVDNVCLQATDNYLVSGPKNPLSLLSPSYIQDLTPSQLEHIAGEDASMAQKRQQLKKEISDLKAGKEILIERK